MKAQAKIWLRVVILFIELCLIVATVAAPLVFTEAVVANFVRILELVARIS